ncbi:MAG: NADH-quinone oxidoreductase subunit L [Proteobacteria bacterium]|nr:NADH-quinone oxidoreductase subunit L [Pseudomonadota bacterium]
MLWIVLLAPLVGAIVNGLFLRKASKNVSHGVGVLAMAVSFAAAVAVFMKMYSSNGEPQIYFAFDWLQAGGFSAPFKYLVDHLSGMMMLVVTGIGTLIHIYAGGYMHEEESTYRFFTYLNLFVFMMLQLVLGDNLMVMFVGWEGVGLCSYLLIGYWYTDDKNAAAGMKAFLVNRIGDIGFLLAIFLTYKHFGTVSFSELKNLIGTGTLDAVKLGAIGWITLCLFIGATGKSAQIPLYIWLPDAMAGPTPVSALIHAATMVTAGIFMMTRLNFMFYLAPSTMHVIAVVGALTAFFAATIALVQSDIKKVLAYSTVSQLGYMVLACGVGAFDAGVFHLFTHACFKALMFLGAGSVIVAMHHEQDMFKMGGLKKYMPITHAVFLVGVLAIIGMPPFAGFFSKDEVLWKAYIGAGPIIWGIGVVTAGCTSFYMVRLLCLTFYGDHRGAGHHEKHDSHGHASKAEEDHGNGHHHSPHETGPIMWAPLVVLAIMSAGVGLLGIPHVLGGHNLFAEYLKPVMLIPAQAKEHWEFLHAEYSHSIEMGLMGVSVVVMLIASSAAIALYGKGPKPILATWKKSFAGIHTTLSNKYYVDEFYGVTFVKTLREMSQFLWAFVDVKIIDGIVNGFAELCRFFGGVLSFKMSGSIHRHAMVLVVGLVCLLSILVFN